MADGKTVLITGATGFIGSHAACALASGSAGIVVALVRRSADEQRVRTLRQAGVTLARGDITDRSSVREALRQHAPSGVLHLAALCGSGRGRRADYQKVNVEGTTTLLEEAQGHGVERFVFCSSVGVHGTIPGDLPATVNSPFDGDSEYHRSKIRGEEAVQHFIDSGLDAFIVRPTITYGRGDTGFPATLVELVRRRRFPLPRREVLVHLLEVGALCRLFGILLSRGSHGAKVIIAADREPVPLADLVHLIHRRCHGRGSSSAFLPMPWGATRLLAVIAGIVGSEKWRTRIRLISESWHYRTDAGTSAPDYGPPDTLTAFPESMCR